MRPQSVAAHRGLRPSYICRHDVVRMSARDHEQNARQGRRTAVIMSGKMPAKKLRLKDWAASADEA